MSLKSMTSAMTTESADQQPLNSPKASAAQLNAYRANGPQTGDNISRQTLFWLLLTNLAVLSPLFDKTTPWTLGICAICLLWRIGIYVGKVAKPPRYLVTSLAVGAAITLALVSGTIGLLNALVNLLILGYALKYIEMRSVRDVRAVVIVGYFLIALTFIDHQSMLNTVHLIGVTIINTCVLVTLYQSQHRWQHTAWIGAKLLLQSMPLALLLFFGTAPFCTALACAQYEGSPNRAVGLPCRGRYQ